MDIFHAMEKKSPCNYNISGSSSIFLFCDNLPEKVQDLRNLDNFINTHITQNCHIAGWGYSKNPFKESQYILKFLTSSVGGVQAEHNLQHPDTLEGLKNLGIDYIEPLDGEVFFDIKHMCMESYRRSFEESYTLEAHNSEIRALKAAEKERKTILSKAWANKWSKQIRKFSFFNAEYAQDTVNDPDPKL